MSGRRLAAYVHVADDSGMTHAFGPTDTVPKWAADKITNPDAWATTAPADEDAGDDTPPADDDSAGGYEPTAGPPAKAGKGSAKENWAAYAEHHQVEIAPDATREQIIAAVDAVGVPVE